MKTRLNKRLIGAALMAMALVATTALSREKWPAQTEESKKRQAAVAQERQFLPIDAPFPRLATIGGIVATNAQGLWRPLFGTPRDWSDSEYAWLSAVRVVDADTDVGVEM